MKTQGNISCGQDKETLFMTYKTVGRLIIKYAAPVWSINNSIDHIQVAPNASAPSAPTMPWDYQQDHTRCQTLTTCIRASRCWRYKSTNNYFLRFEEHTYDNITKVNPLPKRWNRHLQLSRTSHKQTPSTVPHIPQTRHQLSRPWQRYESSANSMTEILIPSMRRSTTTTLGHDLCCMAQVLHICWGSACNRCFIIALVSVP